MPRSAKRVPSNIGAPSHNYADRPDRAAQNARHQPNRTPTGQAYGEAKALHDAQAAVPLPQAAPAPVAQPQMVPGTRTPLDAQAYTPPDLAISSTPSQRPGEHVSTGLGVGPGAGPSPTSNGRFGAAALLASIAAATGDATMAALASTADRQGF